MSDTIEPLRLAVVGAGIMGANHARVARHLPGIELVAVVDPDLERARAACGVTAAVPVATVAELGDIQVDAAVVAVPTAWHVPAATELAARGVHLLVEKPLAPSVADAESIIAAAEAAGVVLAVGHIERFNAAVAELPQLLDEPIHIEASRIGAYSARVADGVIFDLMIHDLDIVLSFFDDDVEAIDISGVSRAVRSSTEDVATATIRFSNGVTAAFNTSRLGQQKVRTVEITQLESTVIADLVRRDVTIHRMSRQEYLSDEGTRYRQSSVVEIPFLETAGEPLQLELAHFADCIRTGRPPRVGGRAGLRALALAAAVSSAIAPR
jgi:predicted dehydrogenase